MQRVNLCTRDVTVDNIVTLLYANLMCKKLESGKPNLSNTIRRDILFRVA